MTKNYLHFETHEHTIIKEWVVFLHGAGGSTATWKYQIEEFIPYYNVLLLDLRDHGESKNVQPDYESYNFDIITADIVEILRLCKIEKAHFITLSFGSVLMQHLSMRHPSMIASAIFAGGIFKANIWIKSFVHLARFFNVLLPYNWMYSIFSYLLMPKQSHQKSRSIYKKQAKKLSPQEYMKWVGLYAEFFQLLDQFFNQKIEFPGLIIMGEDDFVFLKAAKQFADGHSKVDMNTISKAGHICNIDQPAAFNQMAMVFLKNHAYLPIGFSSHPGPKY